MNRGQIYLVRKPAAADPRRQRAFVIVSRQVLIDSQYESVVCAPIYSKYLGLDSQVEVGTAEGLKHDSAIHCDGLISIAKHRLTDFLGSLSRNKLLELESALKVALEIE
jgi:mRNA interferase MazF